MKKFFSNKNNIIALVGLVLSIVGCVALILTDKAGHITEIPAGAVISRIFVGLFMSAAMGFVFMFFLHWQGFLIIFCAITFFSAIRICIEVTAKTNASLVGIILTVLISVALCWRFYSNFKTNKIAINGLPEQTDKQKEKEAKMEAEVKAMIAEDSALKAEIGYLENSIILANQMGTLFQVIKTDKSLFFHRIGTILKGFDKKDCIKEFENLDILLTNKKDYKIDRAQITEQSAVLRENISFIDFGTLKIKTTEKTRRFSFINQISEEELKKFFGGDIKTERKFEPQPDDVALPEEKRPVLNKLNLAIFLFSIASAILATSYVFIDTVLGTPALSIICMLTTLTPYVLYVVFHKHLDMQDINISQTRRTGKISILYATLMPTILLFAKCCLSFFEMVSYDYVKMLLISLGVFAVLCLIIFLTTKEFKKKKSIIFVLAFFVLLLSPSLVVTTNTAFDYAWPEEIACEVIEKPTHTNNNGEVTYYISISYKDITHKREVSNEIYNSLTIGDTVTAIRHSGAFGIETVTLRLS
ncbi:MAG: hypothetical protein J6K39_00300 [Clostridia bacterium]|nr:hypothetical protein [Clostridia bacterium]